MSVMASQITSLTIVYSTVYAGADKKKTSKLRVTGLCVGNSPVTCIFPAQTASNAENVSIWWRHHVYQHVPSANRKINQCDINHSNLTTGSFQTDILIRTQFYCLPNSVYNSITVSP